MRQFEHHLYDDTSETWLIDGWFLASFEEVPYEGKRAETIEELISAISLTYPFPVKVSITKFPFERPDLGSMLYSGIPTTAILL